MDVERNVQKREVVDLCYALKSNMKLENTCSLFTSLRKTHVFINYRTKKIKMIDARFLLTCTAQGHGNF